MVHFLSSDSKRSKWLGIPVCSKNDFRESMRLKKLSSFKKGGGQAA
jgi:hypothetical protein